MEAKFNLTEVVKTSWEALKSQIWILIGLMIGMGIISLIINFLSISVQGSILASLVVAIISLAISGIFGMGYIKNLFQTLDGTEPQFSAYGQQAGKLITYIIAGIIYTVIITIGIFLLIIPGIYLALRLQFFMAYIVEEDAGIIESLQRSWEITKDQALQLFLLALVMILFCFVGILLIGIGILVAAPLCYMMYCVVFRKLNSPLNAIEE